MKTISIIVLAVSISLYYCENKNSDESIIDEMSAQRGYRDWYLESFRCGLFVPLTCNSQSKYPLIIFLHGRTDTTTWNLGWYNEPFLSSDPCIVMTPKCPEEEEDGWGNSWDPRTSPMMRKTYEMLELVKKAFNLDTDRFYIYGSSMGGYGTYGAIKKNPDMFAAGYVECANGNTEMADILADIPFWIFHGSEDPVVAVQGARDMYNAVLEAGGIQIRYTEYQGVGHNAWDYTKNETTLPWWLLAQRRGVIHGVPDTVINFTGARTNDKKVLLEWNMPADLTNPDNQIWYCRIYRDGDILKEVYNNYTSYIDSTVNPGSSYFYRISAVNYFFRESALSSGISITPE